MKNSVTLNNRRNFIKTASFASAGLLGINSLPAMSLSGKDLPKELTVVFQGDSITDAGRDKSRY